MLAAGGMVAAEGQGGGAGRGGAQASATQSRPSNTYVSAKTDVVEGCLKPTATAGVYRVDNAMPVKNGAVGTSGATANSYTVVGVIPPSVKLKDHVGDKVQLSGSIIDGAKFDMSDFKMVSKRCP
jgi:hypothetical protein